MKQFATSGKIATSALFAAVALVAWSLPAAAGRTNDRHDPRSRGYGQEDRIQHRLVNLASELRSETKQLEKKVERRDDHRDRKNRRGRNHDRYDRKTVAAVDGLDDAAQNFERVVRRDRVNTHQRAKSLDTLRGAYRTASYELQRDRASRDVHHSLARIGSLLGDVQTAARVSHGDRYATHRYEQRPQRAAYWSPWTFRFEWGN